MRTFEELIEWYYARPAHKRISPQFVPREEFDMLIEFAEAQGKRPTRGSLLLLGTEFLPEVKLAREQPVVWAKRHESIHAQEDDWRSHGIA